MIDYIWCPFCDKDFDLVIDEDKWRGICHFCGEKWYCEKEHSEDYSDSWIGVYWDKYEP